MCSPNGDLGKLPSKYKKIVYNLILFGERYKQIVTLSTFIERLKTVHGFLISFSLKNNAYFLVYSFIGLDTQKCGELEVETGTSCFPWRQKF